MVHTDYTFQNLFLLKLLVKCCTPGTEKNCPIMVWFHPGDFSSQDGSPQKFGPQLFMENNEVVLVSINYRLGPWGFLSMETEEAPGNLGLRHSSSFTQKFIHFAIILLKSEQKEKKMGHVQKLAISKKSTFFVLSL